ncbi:MAG: LD-carboxypeptidase [Rickettsiales bacterium]|jgi:muramoyltetrapeptide carboxypeptidase LdcA involved in peptidoglycan recycling|nr:LD-carboxypeptidase [Rickettsiales bacterium]
MKHFRVIAPSSAFFYNESEFPLAISRFREMGIEISFGKCLGNGGLMGSAPLVDRVREFNEAFLDDSIDGIITIIGGTNSQEMLDFIDWENIKKHPKFFCGFSDITVLQNALLAKTGMVSFSGPHFTTMYHKQNAEYAIENFKLALNGGTWELHPSSKWADDKWYMHQDDRTFYPNDGWKVLNAGTASGRIIGGNNSSLALLQGTEYMPSLKDSVLFLEETELREGDDDETFEFFLRQLGGIEKLPDFDSVRGLVIGRFHKGANVTDEKLQYMMQNHPKLQKIPVIANVDFGHTTPIFTFPIGGYCDFSATVNGKIKLQVGY